MAHNFAENTRYKNLSDFKGVDYASLPTKVSEQRATEMSNLIHRDGSNQKRYGWEEFYQIPKSLFNYEQIADKEKQINGIWQFKDSFNNEHFILHCGRKLYSLKLNEDGDYITTNITNTSTYYPNCNNKLNTQNKYYEYINNSITNDRSFGIINNNRLYIFCGTYLVYGSWDNGETYELRVVEDNEDTYIPTTTIGISYDGSSNGVVTSLDDLNLLSSRRYNMLIGANINSIDRIINVESNIDSTYNTENSNEPNTLKCWIGEETLEENSFRGLRISFTFNSGGVDLNYDGIIPINEALDTGWVYGVKVFNDYIKLTNLNEISQEFINSEFPDGLPLATSFFPDLFIRYRYDSNNKKVEYMLVFSGSIINSLEVKTNCGYTYQLDCEELSNEFAPILKDMDDDVIIPTTDYEVDYEKGRITFKNDTYYAPYVKGQSNIRVEFISKDKALNQEDEANKINKCKFGILFGYNNEQYLFVSGNSDYPNTDWHSSNISTNSNDINVLDFTYFASNSWANVGSNASKITGYSLLEDTTLGIHKEDIGYDGGIYIRTIKIDEAVNLSGETIDNTMIPYFPQSKSVIGESALSIHTIKRLAGDDLFLSKNGIYSIVLNSNIKTNDRYARERSKLVNNRLTKENDLSNATAIIFDNRYYLAVNDKVYIADARFKTQLAEEMDDTYSYEWWVWDNVPVRIWFIYNNKLCFGTENGRLCSFETDSFEDKYYINFNNMLGESEGTLMLSNSKFSFARENYPYLVNESKIEFLKDSELYESIPINNGDININVGIDNVIAAVANPILYHDYIKYLKDRDVYLNENNINNDMVAYRFVNFNDDNYSFNVVVKNNTLYEQYLNEFPKYNKTPEYNDFKIDDIIIVNKNIYKLTYKSIYDQSKGCYWDDITSSILTPESNSINNITSIHINISNEIRDIVSICDDDSDTGINDDFYIKDISGLNRAILLSNGNIFVKIHIIKPVKCLWESKIMDLGTIDFSKTLKYITISQSAITNCQTTIGVKTKYDENIHNYFESEGFNIIDYGDFTNFTFENSSFNKSYTKKLKIRNFNFMQLYYMSNNNRNCVVNDISLSYILTKRNKGVK